MSSDMPEMSSGPERSNEPMIQALRDIVFGTADEFYGPGPKRAYGKVPFYQYQDAIIGRFCRYYESVAGRPGA